MNYRARATCGGGTISYANERAKSDEESIAEELREQVNDESNTRIMEELCERGAKQDKSSSNG